MSKLGLFLFAAFVLFVPQVARADELRMYNMSDSTVTFYWKAAGCAGVTDGRMYVCEHVQVSPGQSASYSYPGGTSSPMIDASCRAKNEDVFKGPDGVKASDFSGTGYITDTCAFLIGTPAGQSRGDLSAEVTVAEGYWGTWHPPIYCDGNGQINGIERRIEAKQGDGDDTGLNAIRFSCTNNKTLRYANYGLWGDWDNSVNNPEPQTCLSGGFNRARMKMEPDAGVGDDTAANYVEFGCSDNTHLTMADTGWGSWGDWAQCPASTEICGLKVRVEEAQGDGDDTALNGLVLECCPK